MAILSPFRKSRNEETVTEVPHPGLGLIPTHQTMVNDIDVTNDDEVSEYPEGGSEAWLVVLGAWCAMIPSMGLLNTIGVIHAWIAEHQLKEYSESNMGWIVSSYTFFLYIGAAQIGPIFDAHDIRWVIVPGSIGMVASMMCFSVSESYYQLFLSFGVLGGLSASLQFTPAISAVGHWFHKRRALATGIACTAGGIGGIVFPLMILYLAPRIGFPWTIRAIGLICFLTGTLSTILLKKRLPHNKKAGSAIDLRALKDTTYALTTLAVWLVEFAVFIPYTYISSYGLHAAMSPTSAYRLMALLNAGAIPGRALPGYVADRFGPFNTMTATSFVCAVFIFALWLSAGTSEIAITAFAVLFGFWSGAAISLTPVCVAAICRIEDVGKRNGTTFSLASFGPFVGVPIAGAILQASGGDYRGLIAFAGAAYLAACVAFLATRVLAGGWRWSVF